MFTIDLNEKDLRISGLEWLWTISCFNDRHGPSEDFNIRIKKGLTGVRQSPIINQFYTDQYTPEYSLKKAFDFLDRKEFNYYMWWFQFIDKEDANLRIESFSISFDGQTSDRPKLYWPLYLTSLKGFILKMQ